MGFNQENYTCIGMHIPMLFILLILGANTPVFASDYLPADGCNIGVLEEPRVTSRAKGPRQSVTIFSGHTKAPWNGISNARVSDNKYISTTLKSGAATEFLRFSDFNMNIPEGAIISGLQIFVEGRVIGDSTNIQTKNLYLVNELGERVPINANKMIAYGSEWEETEGDEDSRWQYGFNSYDWGGALSRDMLNSPEFGLELDIANHSAFETTVLIDHVEVEVFYTPIYELCIDELHQCIAFIAPKTYDIVSYSWTLPPGFKELNDGDPDIFNILLDGAQPGIYDVCVDIEYTGYTEQCCRQFELLDCSPSVVGDYIWEDINGNGVQEEEEPPLSGISLQLYDEHDQQVGTTSSDGEGRYEFNGIERGYYYVKVADLGDYVASNVYSHDAGTNNDLDTSNGLGTSESFVLRSADTLSDIDLGLVKGITISGKFWQDLNANGINENDPSVDSIKVELHGPDFVKISTVANESGNYVFDGLLPGDYRLKTYLPEDFKFTKTGEGDAQNDSDFNSEGWFSVTGLLSGDVVEHVDGGMYKSGTIGNYVWYDFNVNGIQDSTETGISNVLVTLRKGEDVIGEVETDSAGFFTFFDVDPGHYHMSYGLHEDYIVSLSNAGEDDNADSEVEMMESGMQTPEFEFLSCDTIAHIDAGFIFKPGTIEGVVWSDDNLDGQRQEDETRSISATVELYNSDSLLIETQEVGGERTYKFENLQPADFFVKFSELEDHVFSPAGVGDESTDSDITSSEGGTTDMINIVPDEVESNIDAGYSYLYSSLTGRTWNDENRNHVRDADEVPFADLNVKLVNSDNIEIQSTTTESDGTYNFEEIRRGEYYVVFSDVEDYLFVTPHTGNTDDDSDVTASIVNGSTDIFSIAADTEITSIDGGYILEVGTITGQSWMDINFNGINDDNQSFSGIGVTLYDQSGSEMANLVTDESGNYSFELVPVGSYYVKFAQVDDYIYSPSGQGSDNTIDSDVNEANGQGSTSTQSLENQDDVVEYDAGYILNKGRLEGYVWKDSNENGQQDSGESAVSEINITLYNSSGSEIGSTRTNAQGTYNFEDLTAGSYHIKADIADNNVFTAADQGDDVSDSDISAANGDATSSTFEILPGNQSTKIDAGVLDDFGNIYGVAWCDENENGILENNEDLLFGVQITLFSEGGVEVATLRTSTNGAFAFPEVESGAYYITFSEVDDKNFTIQNAGSDPLFNSYPNQDGRTDVINVTTGAHDYIVNAGYQFLPGSISGLTWMDLNNNSINDDNSPIPGIGVRLYDSSNNEIANTNSDGNGVYFFTDLRRGDYYVVFEQRSEYLYIISDIGASDQNSDIKNSNGDGSTDLIAVAANSETTNIDGGYISATGSISGSTWQDLNKNNINDDETPYESVVVKLYNVDGNELLQESSDGSGNYTFNNVENGSYYIQFESIDKYLFSAANEGEEENDSDVTTTNGEGTTDVIVLEPNGEITNIDAGYIKTSGSISGLVWLDNETEDGIRQDGETLISEVAVALIIDGNEMANTSTDENGSYSFTDIDVDEYQVRVGLPTNHEFVPASQGEDTNRDSDITDIEAGLTSIINVANGSDLKYDAGLRELKAGICGLVWFDSNENGVREDGEEYVQGLGVNLYNMNGDLTATVQTGEDGKYNFGEVVFGEYYVQVEAKEEYAFTTPNNGEEDVDSDITGDNGDGTSASFMLDAKNVVDAGLVSTSISMISGKVWSDGNDDNVYNDGDGLVEGIIVNIINSENQIVQTITTDSEGNYKFSDLNPGEYLILIEDRADTDFVEAHVGEDEAIDSDVILVVDTLGNYGTTEILRIGSGQSIENVDAGVRAKISSISGLVWADLDKNNINNDDTPIEGVDVTLLNSLGEELNSAITNSAGEYSFDGVTTGSYYVVFPALENRAFVDPNVGDDEASDSDVTNANGTGSTDPIDVMGGISATNVDAGYVSTLGSISGKIWKDINNNDVNDDDFPYANISVRLTNATGEELSSTSTDENGCYRFEDLQEGNYIVAFDSITNYSFSAANVGDNEEIDSDVTNANGAGTTELVTIEGGSTVSNVDAGYNPNLAGIAGKAWNDSNENHINDDNDPKSGITVRLNNAAGEEIATTTTEEDGCFVFEEVEDGKYIVVVDSIDTYIYSDPFIGENLATDSDITGNNGIGSTDTITVSNHEFVNNIGAGYISLIKRYDLSGSTWLDTNNDNINNDESPLVGITVFLVDSTDVQFAITESDSLGNYYFEEVDAGEYFVVFGISDEYSFAVADQGDDESIDSDVVLSDSGFGTTQQVNLDQDISNVDAGYQVIDRSISLSGRTWVDSNMNNQNDDDNPYENILVTLYDTSGSIVAEIFTDSEGNYSFENVVEGDYYVHFSIDTIYGFVEANIGDDERADSDVTGSNGSGTTETITVFESVESIDAGYLPLIELYSISGEAWKDENKDNLRNDDNPFSDIEITLYNSNGDVIRDVFTDSLGRYEFKNLVPGDFYIQFESNELYEFAASNEGEDDNIDSEVTGTNGDGTTEIYNLSADLTGVDAGYKALFEFYNIAGQVWIDENENNLNDDLDWIPGVEVTLYDTLNNQVGTTTTDSLGNYSFEEIIEGSYYVVFSQDTIAYSFVEANAGEDDTLDSEVTNSNGAGSTDVFILSDNLNNVNAGNKSLLDYYSFSGKVWNDQNENHINDDDRPLSGIPVAVIDTFGVEIATILTDSTGEYSFDKIVAGVYYISFAPQENLGFVEPEQGDDESIDSDVTGENGEGTTDWFVLVGDQENIDAGYVLQAPSLYSISGGTWQDANRNHINDSELGLQDIVVALIDTSLQVLQTTTTDSLGDYRFLNLSPGKYAVIFAIDTLYNFSDANIGEDDTVDSDVILTDTLGGITDTIMIVDMDIANVDAGYILQDSLLYSISGGAWKDANRNHINDAELGLQDIVVALIDTSLQVLQTTTTDSLGDYRFINLNPGKYAVIFAIDTLYDFSDANVGEDDTVDSDVILTDTLGGITDTIMIVDMDIANVDAGYISKDTVLTTGNITGIVWTDSDPDNVRTNNEALASDIVVNLLNKEDEIVASTTTDSTGMYSFLDIEEGEYEVQFVIDSTMLFVEANQGGDDDFDSDVINEDGTTIGFILEAGASVNLDAGIKAALPAGSLCGNVWLDANGDGINNEGEEGVTDVLVNLYAENGTLVDSSRTTIGGFYSITDILGDNYYLEFITSSDYLFTNPKVGEEGLDSDVTGANGLGTTDVFLGSGKVKMDAGLIQDTGSYISGKVWGDTDADNTYGARDVLVEGHNVYLVNGLARRIAETVTAADGSYRFDITETGVYAVFFEQPEGLVWVAPDASGDDKTDSDVLETLDINGIFGSTNLINFTEGDRLRDVDAGIEMTSELQVAVTGVVWQDTQADGIRQTDEPLMPGITVKLIDASTTSQIESTVTDGSGMYAFNNLVSGDYIVEFDLGDAAYVEANLGDDDNIDSDVEDGETGRTAVFTYTEGTVLNYDAGVSVDGFPNTVCGFIWEETNSNSLYDRNDELAKANVEVKLFTEEGAEVSTTTTNEEGIYSFVGVDSGSYYIVVLPSRGEVIVTPNIGDDDTTDSDITGSQALGSSDLFDADLKVKIDAGIIPAPVGLSGKVWGDTNEDNTYGHNDILISGHEVALVNSFARVIEIVTTDEYGRYNFPDVDPGSYAIFFRKYDDTQFVNADATGNEETDSDVVAIIESVGPYGSTNLYTFNAGEKITDIDAGIISTVSTLGNIAGVVWNDTSADAVRQINEEGRGSIEVKLFDTSDNEISSTITNENGSYGFQDIAPGEYYVRFILTEGEFVEANQGGDDSVDSDVEDFATGATGVFMVVANETTSIDAGLVQLTEGICGTIWFDFNENGLFDNGEEGQPENEVELYTSDNLLVGTTTTNTKGFYTFDELPQGEYYIKVFLGGAYAFTEANFGEDETIDSDISEANGERTSDTFNFESGQVKIDGGLISIIPSFISGKVWEDLDNDHTLTDADQVLPEYTVYLYLDGAIVDTAMSAEEGTYIFENLDPGFYKVLFPTEEGTFFAQPNIPGEENKDSDVTSTVEVGAVSYGSTDEVIIGSGQVKVNIDAGLTKTEQVVAQISGNIFVDVNENNVDDDLEYLGEVIVSLYNDAGALLEMVNANGDGEYVFAGVETGVYAVQFTIPDNYNFVTANVGEDEEIDSDVELFDANVGITATFSLTAGQNVSHIDAGVKPVTLQFSSIGDFVWLDIDEDGIIDLDERGMDDINIELYDARSDEMVLSTTTGPHPTIGEKGFYSFDNLENGEYYVKFFPPTGYAFTQANQGEQFILDSDVTGANGFGTTNTIVVDGVRKTDIDAGMMESTESLIGDFVFNDLDFDGVQDEGEGGINNIRVRLLNESNEEVDQTFTAVNSSTGANGHYSFSVTPGKYYLKFDLSSGLSFSEADQGEDDEKDSDVNSENGFGTTSLFEIVQGDRNLSIDAGLLTEPANVGDRIWVDLNGDGVQDADEDGLNDVTVNLYDEGGNQLQSVVTASVDDNAGYYTFENINSGNYYIEFVVPENYLMSPANVGGNDAFDSDITDAFGRGTTSLFTLSSAEDDLDIDGGVYIPSTLGNFVWLDRNENGLQDTDEPGEPAVTIELLNSDGAVLDTAMTDENGMYSFKGLRQGLYSIKVQLPSDLSPTLADVGEDDSIDSDVQEDGTSSLISIPHGTDFIDLDIGLVPSTIAFSGSDNELIAKVYPNPTTGYLVLDSKGLMGNDEVKEVQIFNSNGNLVKTFDELSLLKSSGAKQYELSLTGLQSGVYLIKAKVGSLTYRQRIILIEN